MQMMSYPQDPVVEPNAPVIAFEFEPYLTTANDYDENIEEFYTDVHNGDWFEPDVLFVDNYGIMNGIDDQIFAPNMPITRAMVATILMRYDNIDMFGESYAYDDSPGKFKDLSNSDWYSSGINWCADNGIIQGYEDGTFRPNDQITRQDLATILFRYIQFKGFDMYNWDKSLSFSDAGQISNYAIDAVSFLVDNGVISGMDNGSYFAPKGNATRAQVAKMLRYIDGNVLVKYGQTWAY